MRTFVPISFSSFGSGRYSGYNAQLASVDTNWSDIDIKAISNGIEELYIYIIIQAYQ